MGRVPFIAAGLLALLGVILWLTGAFDGPPPPAAPAPAAATAPAPAPEPAPEPAPAPAPAVAVTAPATSLRPIARPLPAAPAAPAAAAPVTVTIAQKIDAQRYFDLREIAAFLRCSRPGTVLPFDAADPAFCFPRNPAYDPRDPLSGAPYRYERLNDAQFRLCTTLEDPGAFWVPGARSNGFDPATGCLTGAIRG
jgi:hypothetical protein